MKETELDEMLASQKKNMTRIHRNNKKKETGLMKEHQPISAVAYREIINGLLSSLDTLMEQNAQTKNLLEDHNLTNIPAYGVALGQEGTYTALKKRILSDLDAAQQEADSFEGLDA